MNSKNLDKKPITLNYSKLKSLIEKAGYTLRDFSYKIDRSESWLFAAEKKDSLRVSDLCLMCELLNVPIQAVFDNNIETGTTADLLTEQEILTRLLSVNKEILSEVKKLSN